MEIIEVKKPAGTETNESLAKPYDQFVKLRSELIKKDLTTEIINKINESIKQLNASHQSEKAWKRQARKSRSEIMKMVTKELKLVTKNQYRNMWFILGMSAFGVPIGVAIGLALGNIAFLGIGFPFGMVIGALVGINMDKKAFKEGRQLDIELGL